MAESKEQAHKLNPQEQEQQESSPSVLNRRQFIGAGAAAAAALVLPKSAQAYVEKPGMRKKTGGVAQNFSGSTGTPLTSPSDTSFYQPDVISSLKKVGEDYGTLESILDIAMEEYPRGSQTYIRRFNVTEVNYAKFDETNTPFIFKPGPTFCVSPGDKFDLDVTNNLPVDIVPPPVDSVGGVESTYCLPTPANTPGCFNTTNLHFHGLHVSPLSIDTNGNTISSGNATDMGQIKESSDDVLYALAPNGGHNKYCPWLPAFHAPGTHWYHAHHHGSTGLQAASGLAGALIVKEPPGHEVCKGAPDVVMIMQEKPEALTGVPGLTDQEKLDRGVYERTGRNVGTFLINGTQNPTLNLQQGEIQRWRFINATSTPRAFTLLQLQDNTGNPVAWYRIAVDGITLYGKQMNDPSVLFGAGTTANGVPPVKKVLFAPGNRVDMLVNLPPGNYTLQKLADRTNAGASKVQLLATIVVSDTPYSNADQLATSFSDLMTNGIPIPPQGIPDYLQPITKVDNYNQTPVVFQASPNTPTNRVTTAGRGKFQISNTQFDPRNLANIQADLGSREEWIVANVTNGQSAAHPFHIHVNPFKVVAIANIDSTTQGNINGAGTDYSKIYNQLKDNLTWNDTAIKADGTGIDPTIWWDTFTIPQNTAVKIQHRFDDYWGNFVLHCHILLHEDQGMMWAVRINDPDGKGINPCQQLITPVVTT